MIGKRERDRGCCRIFRREILEMMLNDHLKSKPQPVLIVDDEPDMQTLLAKILVKKGGYQVFQADSGEKGLEIVRSRQPAVVLTDVKMPGMDGVEFFRRLQEIDSTITTIIMTGYGTVEMAVQTLKNGVYDFFQKPFDNDQILHAVARAMERTELLREKRRFDELRRQLPENRDSFGFIGNSPRLLQVQDLLRRLAPSTMTVLIRGESGTGKELAARALHAMSNRAKRRMVTVNCPALPEHILESELFGYCKGAFTGADRDKDGLFIEADHSTILLDEIADIPVSIQTKLLRVLEEKAFERVGGNRTIYADVRIIAATNKDLSRQIEAGLFREDLYYRINVLPIRLPCLREREKCIVPLARVLLEKLCKSLRRPDIKGFTPNAIASIQAYAWPGNIRQLANTIERAVILEDDGLIHERSLFMPAVRSPRTRAIQGQGLPQTALLPETPEREEPSLASQEKDLILKILEECLWVQKNASKRLKISPRALNYKINRLGITHPHWRRNKA